MRLYEIEDSNSDLLNRYKSAVDLAIEKYKKGIAIYRGSKKFTSEIIKFSDPASRETDRVSTNTYNYYTLWMDNDPDWAEYPKRSKSLICSTLYTTARDYGKVAVVVPLTNCNIGVCPEDDLWYSFKITHSLIRLTGWLFNHFEKKWKGEDNENINYQQLIQKLENTVPDGAMYHNPMLEDTLRKYNNALDMMHNEFTPSKNGFLLTTWNEFNITGVVDKEVWLSAPCLLIPFMIFSKLARPEDATF